MNSVFSNNTAGSNGGGLVIWSSTPTSVSIINSSFVDNQASYGAGLALRENSSVTCTDLLVQNNSATEGGGMAMYESAQVRCAVVGVPGYIARAKIGISLCAPTCWLHKNYIYSFGTAAP